MKLSEQTNLMNECQWLADRQWIEEQIKQLEQENEKFEKEKQELINYIKDNCMHEHYYCDDSWYSCPKAEDGCSDDRFDKDECNCGTDDYNLKLENYLKTFQK